MTLRRVVVLAEGTLDFHHGKTATSLLRYLADEVVAVIDSENAGHTAQEAVGVGGSIPIYGELRDAFHHHPTELVIGIAPRGGGLPKEWRGELLTAIHAGLDIVSGLHYMLNEDQELVVAAHEKGTRLIDVRQAKDSNRVAELKPHRSGTKVVTFVGTDCAVGKMTAALEVMVSARERGVSCNFVATGQTGIMLEGEGVPLDRVIGDFMAGAIEDRVVSAAESADWVLVEGQGSLLHPGYSGVTLALIHGSAPDAMILVHSPSREEIEEYGIAIPQLNRVVDIYEEAASWVKPAKVVGIALNTRDLDTKATERAISEAQSLTRLPVTDPVKFGGDVLVDALQTQKASPGRS